MLGNKDHDAITTYIDEVRGLLPISKGLMPIEASQRAAELLLARLKIAQYKRQLQDQKVKYNSILNVHYQKLLSEASGKTAADREAVVEANSDYISDRENVEITENNIKYIDTVLGTFIDGHLLLRQMGKEQF